MVPTTGFDETKHRRHKSGTRHGGRFAPNPAAAAAEVAAPQAKDDWDAVLRLRAKGPPAKIAAVQAADPSTALETAQTVLLDFNADTRKGGTSVLSVERDADGREWHVMSLSHTDRKKVAVSPVGCRRNSTKPFTSTAGGLKARFEYHDNGGWGYTAGEERVRLADCPATNVIADAERQRMALGQVCADLLNEGRITREDLPKFYGALIRSVRNPYRPQTWAGNLETLLLAYARAGCATQIAATLPGDRYQPDDWNSRNLYERTHRMIRGSNPSSQTLPPEWRSFAPTAEFLTEAAETAPRSSTPADGTLLGSVHNRPGADPQVDCLGAWAAETVHKQKEFFVYGMGVRSDKPARWGLYQMPFSFICRSPEPIPKGRGRIPCGVAETLLFIPTVEPGYDMPHNPTVRVRFQVAAARRSELAAHLAVGGRYPAHHSVVDALLDDPRSDWCETESEFRRKIVTAAVSQNPASESFDARADRLIAEHVIGGQSEDVTETELRCLRTVLNRRCQQITEEMPEGHYVHFHEDFYTPSDCPYKNKAMDTRDITLLAAVSAMTAGGKFPLPKTAERVTGRLGAYTRAVNRLRKQGAEGASAGRLFLQTLLTLPGLPLKKQAELYAFERLVCADYYKRTTAG